MSDYGFKTTLSMTGSTSVRYVVNNDLVGLRGLTQGAPGVTLLSACRILAGNTQGFRRGLVQAVA